MKYNDENYDEIIQVRVTKEICKDIERAIVASRKGEIWYEDTSHFVRCAIIKQLRKESGKKHFMNGVRE